MIWLMMIFTGLFTFGTRFVMLNGRFVKKLPKPLFDALRFVPIAVLTAIIVPAVIIDPTTQKITIADNSRILAALIAIGVALTTRQVVTTIGAGLTTLWFLQWMS